jgi:hypothetical protein
MTVSQLQARYGPKEGYKNTQKHHLLYINTGIASNTQGNIYPKKTLCKTELSINFIPRIPSGPNNSG